ncbi:esterase/lipase family protein [Stenotrophobium rhamnosiphilum]|uniref:Lipase n=1 Tax=Stenotrophobium rhamnosiphilum TaxID=2029166 RepID=A0A2T5MBA7_9GAMM|nr:alpha/beta fold hydrolase [Stenotrophobium rhamnosiphilum]PTU28290.1 lipase [Stenotrophobium rhamnosiphilum]
MNHNKQRGFGLRHLLGAAITALGLLGTMPASAGPFDISPTGANDWNCRPTTAHPRPVVLVHGTLANMSYNMTTISSALKDDGYCVYALNYGGNGFTPITLYQVYGLAPMEQSSVELAQFVDRVLTSTGASKVDIIGHSQGGMLPRHYTKFNGGASKVNHIIGIAPSNHGGDLAGFNKLLQATPAALLIGNVAVGTWCPACMQQNAGTAFMTNLNAGGDTLPGITYTVISTKYDQVVTPYTSQALVGPNVTNIVVQNQCPYNTSEHLSLVADALTLRNVRNALDPANAVTPTCNNFGPFTYP